jgi:glycosyltransferase involved in cell wall biosynthesis
VNENVDKKKSYVNIAETYSDLIYSVPDQAGLQTIPYYHLQIPIDLNRFIFKNNERKVPNVLHLPSEPWKKGTDIIENTINELIEEGVKINFFNFRDIPNENIPAILQDMDVLVDEIVLHGPGVLSLEAMASGCAVATRYLISSPDSFRPPIWNIDATNIKNKLKLLFEDFELRQKLIIEGRRYVEENNNSRAVAKNILDNLIKPGLPDYVPLT